MENSLSLSPKKKKQKERRKPMDKEYRNRWIFEESKFVYKGVGYVPEMYQMFDEFMIMIAETNIIYTGMTEIRVNIDVGKNCFSINCSGNWVPVEMEEDEGVYKPEKVFGKTLAKSSSTRFHIEVNDVTRNKMYSQILTNNPEEESSPTITDCTSRRSWSRITCDLDLTMFKMESLLDGHIVPMMKKRVLDLAACLSPKVNFRLVGSGYPVKSLMDYINLYVQESGPRFILRVSDKLEIGVTLSKGSFKQVSFVNGVPTIKGGTHVDWIANKVAAGFLTYLKRKTKNEEIKMSMVKNRLWLFANAFIDNPIFDSSAKETLTSDISLFTNDLDQEQVNDSIKEQVRSSGILRSLLKLPDFQVGFVKKEDDRLVVLGIRLTGGVIFLEDSTYLAVKEEGYSVHIHQVNEHLAFAASATKYLCYRLKKFLQERQIKGRKTIEEYAEIAFEFLKKECLLRTEHDYIILGGYDLHAGSRNTSSLWHVNKGGCVPIEKWQCIGCKTAVATLRNSFAKNYDSLSLDAARKIGLKALNNEDALSITIAVPKQNAPSLKRQQSDTNVREQINELSRPPLISTSDRHKKKSKKS